MLSVAYLGFHRDGGGGKFFLATSAYTKVGPNHVFQFFPMAKTDFLPKGP